LYVCLSKIYFFSLLVLFLPTCFRCRELLLDLITLSDTHTHTHTHTHTRTHALGRALLDGRSTRRRDLYVTIHNTHNRQTSVPPAGFESAIPASERQQTQALDRATTGLAKLCIEGQIFWVRNELILTVLFIFNHDGPNTTIKVYSPHVRHHNTVRSESVRQTHT
jgi:hypothetical protein